MHPVTTFSIALLYLGLLFGIAYLGDARQNWLNSRRSKSLIYSMALGVYATSWTFYGAVGRASWDGFGYLPIYLGPILLFLFGHRFLSKIIRVSKKQNITSIADFLASRYGKSQIIAVIVSIIATVGIIPYISLQLKAVALSFSLLSGEPGGNITQQNVFLDTAFYIALVLGLFTFMFGIQHFDAKHHKHGLIKAIAFESVFKLVAFVTVGLFITYGFYDGFGSVMQHAQSDPDIASTLNASPNWVSMTTQLLLATLAMFCLPRQFHVLVVENSHKADIKTARWLLPAYLALISIFVIPIAAAGKQIFFDANINPDAYILTIPLFMGQESLALLVFLGGIAASTGMMIVSTITLSTMISNELVLPVLLRMKSLRWMQQESLGSVLHNIRRVTIVGILLLAYIYYHFVSGFASLTSIGLLSFAAVAQFAPSIIGGLYWRRGNQLGAITGLCAGFSCWIYTLLLPAMSKAGWIDAAVLNQDLLRFNWLNDEPFFAALSYDAITYGTAWSLSLNLLFYLGISLISKQGVTERRQAKLFIDVPKYWAEDDNAIIDFMPAVHTVKAQAERFLGKGRIEQALVDFERETHSKLLPNELCTPRFLDFIESQLAAVIGSSTARLVVDSCFKDKAKRMEEVADIVDEATQALQFSRELLNYTIENLSQGVRVTDHEHRILAWNQRYVDMFGFPPGFVRVGRPVEDLTRFNLIRTEYPKEYLEGEVARRLETLYEAKPYAYDRVNPDGKVLAVVGNPMPEGGFVTTFTDITERRKAEQALKDSNLELERRVNERTEELSSLNEQLLDAKEAADRANQSKTRFLASASHDLLQPLNAARLFTSALRQQIPSEQAELARNIDGSLTAAEEILSTILDISKMDAGVIDTHITDFPLSELFDILSAEFSAIAENRGLAFSTVHTSTCVRSDQQLLRRLIQNFLSNAIRYTDHGRILLGCRRRTDYLLIQVWDTGPGITHEQKAKIFDEFKRFTSHDEHKKGLGLGLAIVDRIATVLNHPIFVESTPGKGSMFSVAVPYGEKTPSQTKPATNISPTLGNMQGTRILCIDNETNILEGMRALLEGWGCQVCCATHAQAAMDGWQLSDAPQVIIADYQLDNDKTGLDALMELRQHWKTDIPGILITANKSDEVKVAAEQQHCPILYKPVKPATLRALVSKYR